MPETLRRLREGGDFLVAGLGDSLTQGWMVSRGYFERFVEGLEGAFPEVHIHSINAGVPGDTSRGGLQRMEHVLARNPDLLLVQFGINDLWCGVPLSSFLSNMEAMVEGARRSRAAPLLVISCPLSSERDQEYADPFFDAIRSLGDRYGLPVADVDAHWRARADWDDHRTDDGVHPTDAGHALMAEAVLKLFSD